MFSLDNLLFVFKLISSERMKRFIVNQSINYKNYLELFCPAIDWILQCVCYRRPIEYLNDVLEKCIAISTENHVVKYEFKRIYFKILY